MLEFYSPYYLLFLVLVPFFILYEEKRGRKLSSKLLISNGNLFSGVKPTLRTMVNRFFYIIKIIIFILIVLALARPRSGTKHQNIETEGIDIVLVLDISTSMKAVDFKPTNRLEAAKKIAIEFVEGRKSDRIGLVSFGGESFTQCPLTIDYNMLSKQIEALKFAPQEWDGTAIGNAIGTAVDRLKDSNAKSKVIILLTDGRNNSGEIDPKLASDLAKTFDIKIYTIGAGSKGEVYYPVETMFGTQYKQIQSDIDEELLTEVAENTDGQYFRATNTKALREIYNKISKMEKVRIEVKEFVKYKELYFNYVLSALILLLFSFIIEKLWLKKIPG